MGSTGLKAVAFDAATGLGLAAAGSALPFVRLPRGGCELDAPVIESALMQALGSVASQLGPRVAQVRALSCTGHGAGLYALDRERRLLRGRAVASTDQRATGRARSLALRRGAELFEEVGCQPWAGQPALIAAEVFGHDAFQRGAICGLLFAKDYLGMLLTGEVATDPSDASTAGLLCLETGSWSKLAIGAAGLPDMAVGTLPPIMPSGTVLGKLLPGHAAQCGLPPGLPVVISAIDLLASLVAVGAPQRGQAVAVLGTWCVNAVVDGQREPKPAIGGVVNFGEPGQRLYLENSPSSMANIAWLVRTLQFDSAAQAVDCAMTAPLGALGLRFLPFINGGAPEGASAGFMGLQAQHDRSHMARAVVDAVAALHARHLARLASFGLGVRGPVTALGGGARDARLVGLIASFMGHPMERCGDDETGARGAALYAARSEGISMPGPSIEVVEHDAREAAAYADYYDSFHELVDTLAPAFTQLTETH